MLSVSKNVPKSQVLVSGLLLVNSSVADYYMLKSFATDASKRDRSIISCIIFLAFLYSVFSI